VISFRCKACVRRACIWSVRSGRFAVWRCARAWRRHGGRGGGLL